MPKTRPKAELDAYQIWAASPSKSVAETAADLGVEPYTISNWKQRYDWDGRYAKEHEQIVGPNLRKTARRIQSKADGMADAALDRMLRIVQTGEKDADAINAARVILAYSAGTPTTIHQAGLLDDQGDRGRGPSVEINQLIVEGGSMSTAELINQAAESLATNMRSADRQRLTRTAHVPALDDGLTK